MDHSPGQSPVWSCWTPLQHPGGAEMGVQEAQASKQTVLHVALGGQRWAAGIQRDRQGHVSQEENHRGGCAHLLFKGQAFVDGPGEAGRRAGTADSRPQPPAHVATTAAVHTQGYRWGSVPTL